MAGVYARGLLMARKRIGPTPRKAAKMLRDKRASGRPLTGPQKKYFRAIKHGWKPTGKRKRKGK